LFVPVFETLLCILWGANFRRFMVTVGLLVFLVVVTAGYALQAGLGEPPACGCLGAFARYLDLQDSMFGVFLRNGALVAGLLAWTIIESGRRLRAPGAPCGG
jgi:hypothetical protein